MVIHKLFERPIGTQVIACNRWKLWPYYTKADNKWSKVTCKNCLKIYKKRTSNG